MKILRSVCGLMLLGVVGCAAETSEEVGVAAAAVTCDPIVLRYPILGQHNHGYDATAGDSSQWTCGDANSNSDFGGAHIGNDIWAAEGTPVIATTNGTLTLVGWSDYSGNKVTIIDDCGWYHFFTHLQSIEPGIANGNRVDAGQVIGYVGRTGTASNGVIHLHVSIYPDGSYDSGIDPWPYHHAVEHNTCGDSLPADPPLAAPDGVRRGVTSPESLFAWRWRWDDVRTMPDEFVDSYPDGELLPYAPVLVLGPDDPAVYLLDGPYKRHVPNEAILAAWRWTFGDVQSRTAEELAAIPTGPPVIAYPWLMLHSGGTVFLIDAPFPPPVEPPSPEADAGIPTSGDAGVSGTLSGGCSVTRGSPQSSLALVSLLGLALVVRRKLKARTRRRP